MCKGSQTTSTTSAPNPTAFSAYNDILSNAQNTAATPYTPYSGELVAGVNPQQSAGIANINSMWNYAQPFMQQAAGYATDAATPLTTAQIQQYMSPYTQDVVNATQAQFNNQNQQQRQGVVGNAISQGALGGNREAIAEAELANQQNLAQAPVISGLYNQAYTTGLNTALTEQQAKAQGAYSLGNLGVSGQNADLTGANAQIGAGTLQQGTQQALDAAQYQQFVNQLAYPFQTEQWLAGIGTGVGSQMGGTGTTTGPPPSLLGQGLGAATAGVGALGGTGAFGSAGWLTAMLANGGAVGRASGGVAPEGPITLPETPATLKLQQRQLLNGHRRVQMFPRGTPELPLPRGMNRLDHPNGTFHYDPRKIDTSDIHRLSSEGRENDILDLGPYSKDDVLKRLHGGEIPVAVVERHPDGTEARAAIGTHTTAGRQMAAMNRTKSPGHIVRVEDPRETIGHRLRAFGGRVPGFAAGGTPGPYADAHGWVPAMGISPGSGAPKAPNPPGVQNPDLTKSMAGLGGVFKNWVHSPADGSTGKSSGGDSPDVGEEGGSAAMGGRIQQFADGGRPEMPPTNGVGSMMLAQPHAGVRGWIPRMDIARGRGAPHGAAGVAPPPSLAQQAKEIGSLANMISNPRAGVANDGDVQDQDESPAMYRGGGVANLPFHHMVPHLAAGGSPYDTDYFDDAQPPPMPSELNTTGPASWESGQLKEVPTDFSGVDPGTFSGVAPRYGLPSEIIDGARPEMAYADAGPRSRNQPSDDAAGKAEAQGVAPGINFGSDSKLWTPLMAAGLGMMASRSPFAGVAIGEGGLAGMQTYASERQREDKINSEVKKLAQEADLAQKRLDLQSRPYSEQTVEQKAKLAQEADLAQKRLDLQSRPFGEQTADQRARSEEARREHEARLDQQNRPYREQTANQIATLEETKRQHDIQMAREVFTPIPGVTTEEGHPIGYDKRNPRQAVDMVTMTPLTDDQKKAVTSGGWKPFPDKTTADGDPVLINKQGQTKNAVTGQALGPDTKLVSSKELQLSGMSADVRAHQLAAGDVKGAYVGLPFGSGGNRAKQQVGELARQKLIDAGMTPEEAGQYLSSQSQAYAATGSGLNSEARTAGVREANLKIILKAADAAIPAALEASQAVSRTGWVPINQIIQEGEVIASNPELKEFGMANLQLAEHWARAMNPTGVMRETDRDMALKYLSTADSQPTYARAVAQLQKQINRELAAVHAVKTQGGFAAKMSDKDSTADEARKELGAVAGSKDQKPKTIIQGGHTYTLQSDGSYK